jgi:hypothetical protein
VDGDVDEAELGNRPGEPPRPSGEGLDQMELEVRSGDGEGHTREASTRAHVDDALGGRRDRDRLLDDSAVENVSIPESRRFSRADQPVGDTSVGQDGNELFCQFESVTEDGGSGHGGLWWRDRFESIVGHALTPRGLPAICLLAASFHVKRGAVTQEG